MSRPIKILVVDDAKSVRLYLKEILSSINAKVALADNGEQALTLIQQHEYNAIFMDVEMPGKSGLEVIKQVREQLGFKYTPIIVITGLQDQALIQRAFEYGASDYVTKPLYEHEVLARLKVRLENRELDRQLAQAKMQAENASLAKTEFISRLAHELKTPLNAINGFAQLIQISTVDQDILDKAAYIIGAAKLQESLISEVTDLAKIEGGIIDVNLVQVELDEIIKDTFNLVRPMANAAGISLILPRRSATSYSVIADKTRLQQVLLNVLSNAVKYNRENGEVSLIIKSSSTGGVKVGIKDTGPGIASEDQANMFEPFNRLNASSSDIEGTGLGLPIAKKLMQLMGAKLSVESCLGQGSTFWLVLRGTKNTMN